MAEHVPDDPIKRLAESIDAIAVQGTVSGDSIGEATNALFTLLDEVNSDLADALRAIISSGEDMLAEAGITAVTWSPLFENRPGAWHTDWRLCLRFDDSRVSVGVGDLARVALRQVVVTCRAGELQAAGTGFAELEQLRILVGISLPDLIVTGSLDNELVAGVDPPEGEEEGALPPTGIVDTWQASESDVAFPDDHQTFLRARGLSLQSGDGGPRLTSASVALAPGFDRYLMHLEVADALAFGDAFHIRRVGVDALYEGGLAAQASGRAWLDAAIAVGGEDVAELTLEAELSTEGYRFAGNATFVTGDNGLSIARALEIAGQDGAWLPVFIADCELLGLGISYDTARSEFSAQAHFAFEQAAARLTVTRNDAFSSVDGALVVAGAGSDGESRTEIDLSFVKENERAMLIGSYDAARGAIDVGTLVAALVPDAQIPDAARFTIDRALVAAVDNDGERLVFVSAEMNMTFDLSVMRQVPFLGGLLPSGDNIGIGLRPLATWPNASSWTEAPGNGHSPLDLLKSHDSSLVLPDKLANGVLHCAVDVVLGGGKRRTTDVAIPGTESYVTEGSTDAHLEHGAKTTAGDDYAWLDIGSSLGPLHLSRLGFASAEGGLALKADAALSAAGLTLSTKGLGFTVHFPDEGRPVEVTDPAIDGFGVDLSREPFEFAGAFMKNGDDFAGAVTIGAPTFTLRAVGALTLVGHAPSMFLYGVLDYPLGGPPFFYVDGLAAGFGLHRQLRKPALKELRKFPLVSEVMNSGGGKGLVSPDRIDARDAAQRLASFHDFIQPKVGEYFGAAGVRFTSFKVVEGFALLIVRAGTHTEIELIGTATGESPPQCAAGVPPIAHVELDLDGHFAPDDGIVSIKARLNDNSYVYSGACKIGGGFAFCSWFGTRHHGDFVLSVGGYSPRGKPKKHYPDVERLHLEYQISPEVSLAGRAYFALTPQLVMAGVAVHARAHIGDIEAWFDFSGDFELGWEPYHYDAHVHVEIGAKWGWFHTSASADLHVWGPDFSGEARVHWTVISFTVAFGKAPRRGPLPIDWARFEQAFLADRNLDTPLSKLLTCRVMRGLVDTVGSGDSAVRIVDPSQLTLVISSIVPLSGIDVIEAHSKAAIGVAPMNLRGVKPKLAVVFRRHGENGSLRIGDQAAKPDANAVLLASAADRPFPPALWGDSITPRHDAPMVDAYGELTLRPARYDRGGHADCQRSDLDSEADGCRWFVANEPRPDVSWDDVCGNPAEVIGATRERRRNLLLCLAGTINDDGLSNAYATVLARARIVAPTAEAVRP